MLDEDNFELEVQLGELQFNVEGTYTHSGDDIDLVFNTVLIELYLELGLTMIDASTILTSLEAWGKLEEVVTNIIKSNSEKKIFVNIDDIDEEEDVLGDY